MTKIYVYSAGGLKRVYITHEQQPGFFPWYWVIELSSVKGMNCWTTVVGFKVKNYTQICFEVGDVEDDRVFTSFLYHALEPIKNKSMEPEELEFLIMDLAEQFLK